MDKQILFMLFIFTSLGPINAAQSSEEYHYLAEKKANQRVSWEVRTLTDFVINSDSEAQRESIFPELEHSFYKMFGENCPKEILSIIVSFSTYSTQKSKNFIANLKYTNTIIVFIDKMTTFYFSHLGQPVITEHLGEETEKELISNIIGRSNFSLSFG